jgi:hypothetical protein
MDTQWGAWLRELKAARKGGIQYKPIRRDLPYSLVFAFDADFSGDAFAASLRIAPDASGSTLADFTVSVGDYTDGATNVTLTLTKSQVNALPSDDDFDGLAEVVFDLLHTPSGGEQYQLLGGTILLIGKVTSGA